MKYWQKFDKVWLLVPLCGLTITLIYYTFSILRDASSPESWRHAAEMLDVILAQITTVTELQEQMIDIDLRVTAVLEKLFVEDRINEIRGDVENLQQMHQAIVETFEKADPLTIAALPALRKEIDLLQKQLEFQEQLLLGVIVTGFIALLLKLVPQRTQARTSPSKPSTVQSDEPPQ